MDIALEKDVATKTTLTQMRNPDLLDELTISNIYYFNSGKINIYKISEGKSEKEYTYSTSYNSGDGMNTKYVNNKTPNCPLFDYVYCCGKADLGNGDVASKDGSKYRGRGYIHLTGKYNYNNDFYKPWKATYPNEKRTLKEMVDLLYTDKDLAMKVSMFFWKKKGLNEVADNIQNDTTDDVVEDVTETVNGGGKVGLAERTKYYKNLKDIFK